MAEPIVPVPIPEPTPTPVPATVPVPNSEPRSSSAIASTEVIASGPSQPATPASASASASPAPSASASPKRKRRRWPVVVIVLGVVLALLVAAFVAADGFAKRYAAGQVRDQIVRVLHLEPNTPVAVDLGSGSILLQAASGVIDEVKIHVDTVTFGEITGSAEIRATKVPLDLTKPLDTLGITVTVSEENVKKLACSLSGTALTSIELTKNVIRVGTDLQLLFLSLPVQVDLLPTATASGIGFEPQSIVLGTNTISVADLQASQFSGLAGDLLKTRVVCVASSLPQALTISDVDVVGKNLVIIVTGDGTALGGPDLATNGSCPAAN